MGYVSTRMSNRFGALFVSRMTLGFSLVDQNPFQHFLFSVLCKIQDFIGYVVMGSWKGRGKHYIQLLKILWCKLPTNRKQLSAFHMRSSWDSNSDLRGGRRVLSLCYRDPCHFCLYTLFKFDFVLV